MPRKAGGGQGGMIVTGIDEIDRRLKDLEPKLQRKVIRQAMREGMKLVRDEAKRNAPVRTGMLRRAIKVRGATKPRRGVVQVEVRVGEGDFKGKTFYAAFVEYGSKDAPGRHYMLNSYVHAGPQAKQAAIAAILRGIDQIVKER